jgi:hypothetical protein
VCTSPPSPRCPCLAAGPFRRFLASYTGWTALFYAIAAGLGFTILAPVMAILLFLAPGVLAQLALSVPHWSFEAAQDMNPGEGAASRRRRPSCRAA